MTENFRESSEQVLDHPASKRNGLIVRAAAGVLVLGAVAYAASLMMGGGSGDAVMKAAIASTSSQPGQTLARVNGKPISEMEVQSLVQSGIDRAIVVDRYINKVLAAEQGRTRYQAEAQAMLLAAEREVLSTLYTTRRMQELRDAVTDTEVADYYQANVKDENFSLFKVSYYLSTDVNDINNATKAMREGDAKALGQLKPLVEAGNGFATAAALPYNLGRVVAKMKKGEFSEVLQLRNGLLVLRLDERQQLDKPKQEEVKEEIVQALALERFNKELDQLRKQAKVELN